MKLIAMQVYTESTDGSYLDVKESALVWHYKDADPDFGRWQAKVLSADLNLACVVSTTVGISGNCYIQTTCAWHLLV